jgi:hypothetical protein
VNVLSIAPQLATTFAGVPRRRSFDQAQVRLVVIEVLKNLGAGFFLLISVQLVSTSSCYLGDMPNESHSTSLV